MTETVEDLLPGLPLRECPDCGSPFSAAGLWRRLGDERDVIVLFHVGEGLCEKVYGSAREEQGQLTLLGTQADYADNITPLVSSSDFVIDLANVGRPPAE